MRKTEEEPQHYDVGKGCFIGSLFTIIALVVILILVIV